MRVIKYGKEADDLYRGQCRCGTELECRKKELIPNASEAVVECPVCKRLIAMHLHKGEKE